MDEDRILLKLRERKNPSKSVVLVEDNEDHCELIIEAIKEAGVKCSIIVKNDGEDAWNYLTAILEHIESDIPEHTEERLPDIILLDINLPKISGHELLVKIKRHPILKMIPVIILTTSENVDDMIKAYRNHANSYLCKPLNFDKFIDMIETLFKYWNDTNVTPI